MVLAAPGQVVGVSGSWAAIDRGSSCEAVTRSPLPPTKTRPAAVAGFRFTPDRRQWGQFHVALSRPPRPGATVMLELGGQPFLLVARGREAWSRGTAQDQAIIAALRSAATMKVSARSGRDSVSPTASNRAGRRPRSTRRRRAVRCAALAKSADLH